MNTGKHRVLLGAAPGVGKTYSALQEAHHLRTDGVDVVVGFVETHGRSETAEQLVGLEVVPPRKILCSGRTLDEMDLPAVLARRPDVVLVDELAHTNAPGMEHASRWEDIESLLDAGIDVISTINIHHLESLDDVVASITGIRQRELIPDEVVRRADQIELVDLPQEGIRQRMLAGKIYPVENIDAAMADFFRPGNLGALRELTLSWTADRVEETVERYRKDHAIEDVWETRERVVVGLAGVAGSEDVVRRAARIAMRSRGELLGIHVRSTDGLVGGDEDVLEACRRLLEQFGGAYHEVSAGDVGEALVAFAHSHDATQLVIGSTSRRRWQELIGGSLIQTVIHRSADLDIHVVGTREPPGRRLPNRPAALPIRRRVFGWLLVAGLVPTVTAGMLRLRDEIALQNVLLAYLLLAVAAAWVGGLGPAMTAAIVGFLLGNYLFTVPYGTWHIGAGQDVIALSAFLVVAGAVGVLVGAAARRSAESQSAQAEAATLNALARAVSTETAGDLVARLQTALGLPGVAVFFGDREGWTPGPTAGTDPPISPRTASRVVDLDGAMLAINGRLQWTADDRILETFAAQLATTLDLDRLEADAAERDALSRADDLRTSLLRAVSHDLRSPLAAIRVSVTSLLQDDITWSEQDRATFLDTIDAESGRLERLVADLLDAGRIQSGGVAPRHTEVKVEEVVERVVGGIISERVRVDVPETLRAISTDPGLLERVLENLIRNAISHSNTEAEVLVQAGQVGDRIDLRVIDHGIGIPASDRDRVFLPFQRVGDTGTGGVGLGLAVASGLCNALGHELTLEDTPGGGTTMIISVGDRRRSGLPPRRGWVETGP
jgi:two-component system sensor histidine kinase KdpD